MSYMRWPYYAYVSGYEDDDGREREDMNIHTPEQLEKGDGEHFFMPLDVFDELALMRVAEIMLEAGVVREAGQPTLGEIADRVIAKHHGNFGCGPLGQLRGVPRAIEEQLQEKLKAARRS